MKMISRLAARLAAVSLAATLSFPGSGRTQDLPFAQDAQQREASRGLSETMLSITQRHAVLWFAGTAANWGLASYEIGQLRTRFVEAAAAYRNIPVDAVVPMTSALDAVQAAATQKNKVQFSKSFDEVTASCNRCHQAAGLTFLKVHQPTTAPFSNIQWRDVPSR